MKLLKLALLVPLLLASSCTSGRITERLDTGNLTQSSEINSLMAQLDDGAPGKPIRWEDAWARMQRDNLSIKRTNDLLKEAEKNRSRAWRELVPRVSGYLNLSSGLDELLDFSSDDISRTFSANFHIPNPFNFYATLYAAGLRYEEARFSHELDRRRAYVTLYKAFLSARDISEDLMLLQREMQSASTKEAEEGVEELYRIQQRWEMLKRQKRNHRINVNNIFDTPGGSWDLVGELPDVSFRNDYRKVRIGDDFGKLAMYLYAIRIESAILSRKRVEIAQWPILNFGLSQPPLYSSNATQNYEPENFRLFSGASKSFDLIDPLGLENIQDAHKRFEYTRRTTRQTMEREALRLADMRESYEQLLLMQQRLLYTRGILESDAPEDAEVVLAQLDALNDNLERLTETRRRLMHLDLQYLVWNEKFWK